MIPIGLHRITEKTDIHKSIITRIIHQSWKTKNIPGFFHRLTDSWRKYCFPSWKYRLWTDEDNYNLIKSKYEWFLPVYNKLPHAINKADVSRYFYLYEYGGIYTDIDNECLNPFEYLLANYTFVFGAMKGQYGGTQIKEGYVQNSFMYSRPKQKFWLDFIKTIQRKIEFNVNEVPEALTGPIILSNFITSQLKDPKVANTIRVYPPKYFNPFSWLAKSESPKECKDFNRMNEQERDICRKHFIKLNSYVVQYHAHTWG